MTSLSTPGTDLSSVSTGRKIKDRAAQGLVYLAFALAVIPLISVLWTVIANGLKRLDVPNDLREASYALGVPRWRTVLFVILPTAMTGIITGVMLAVARVMGETAPLLLTIFFTKAINTDPFTGPQGSLPTFIWDQAADPNQNSIDRAWTGALVLIGIIMLLNLIARLVARRSAPGR